MQAEETLAPAIDPSLSSILMRVPFYDTDAMAVVHHSNYLRYCENARIDWFRKRGVLHVNGVQLAAVESHLHYRTAARFDDVLVVEVRLADLLHLSMRFAYTIKQQQDGRVVADGVTVHACVDGSFKLMKIPVSLRTALRSAEVVVPVVLDAP